MCTCVGALLQTLLPSCTSHSCSEMALSGLFIGASTAPEGQDGGVNNLFSPFPHPSRACSPPPLPPLFAQMNVAGLAQSLALHLNGAVSSQDGCRWGWGRGVMVAAATRECFGFLFPFLCRILRRGKCGELSSALQFEGSPSQSHLLLIRWAFNSRIQQERLHLGPQIGKHEGKNVTVVGRASLASRHET